MYIMDIWRSQERSFFWVFFNLFFVYNFKTQRCDDTSVFAVRFAGFSDKSFASRFRGLNPLVPVLVWWNVEGGVKIVDFSATKHNKLSKTSSNTWTCRSQCKAFNTEPPNQTLSSICHSAFVFLWPLPKIHSFSLASLTSLILVFPCMSCITNV